jgi:hypothetical protein
MAMWPKLSEMSCTELEEMAKAIKAEQDKRDDERFRALCKEAANALNALKLEYPWVSYEVTAYCEACGQPEDVNLFDMVDSFEVSHFRK